jgi:hypothetical protein
VKALSGCTQAAQLVSRVELSHLVAAARYRERNRTELAAKESLRRAKSSTKVCDIFLHCPQMPQRFYIAQAVTAGLHTAIPIL